MNATIAKPFVPFNAHGRAAARQTADALNRVIDQINSQVQGVGSVIASSVSITLTHAIHHVSGTAAISTIVPPKGFSGPVMLIPDGLWTTTTGGNIALGTSAVVHKALTLVYDGSLWHPSY